MLQLCTLLRFKKERASVTHAHCKVFKGNDTNPRNHTLYTVVIFYGEPMETQEVILYIHW